MTGRADSQPRDYSIGSLPRAVIPADFNGDGRVDIITGNGAGTLSLLLNTCGSVSSTLPASAIAATAGSGQSAPANTFFATSLQAKVRDSANNPLSGVTVIFTAPLTGASGKFVGGSNAVTADTDDKGVATAPGFFANGTTGSFTVTASLSGGTPQPPSA